MRARIDGPDGGREGATREDAPLVNDREGAIEALMDFHGGFRVAAAIGRKLEEMGTERDSVVVGDAAQVFEAEDGLGIGLGRPRTIGGAGVPGEVWQSERCSERGSGAGRHSRPPGPGCARGGVR